MPPLLQFAYLFFAYKIIMAYLFYQKSDRTNILWDRLANVFTKKRSYHDVFFDDNKAQVKFFYREIRGKIHKMSEEGNDTTINDWMDLIPQCEFVDKWIAEVYPNEVHDNLSKKARIKAGLPL